MEKTTTAPALEPSGRLNEDTTNAIFVEAMVEETASYKSPFLARLARNNAEVERVNATPVDGFFMPSLQAVKENATIVSTIAKDTADCERATAGSTKAPFIATRGRIAPAPITIAGKEDASPTHGDFLSSSQQAEEVECPKSMAVNNEHAGFHLKPESNTTIELDRTSFKTSRGRIAPTPVTITAKDELDASSYLSNSSSLSEGEFFTVESVTFRDPVDHKDKVFYRTPFLAASAKIDNAFQEDPIVQSSVANISKPPFIATRGSVVPELVSSTYQKHQDDTDSFPSDAPSTNENATGVKTAMVNDDGIIDAKANDHSSLLGQLATIGHQLDEIASKVKADQEPVTLEHNIAEDFGTENHQNNKPNEYPVNDNTSSVNDNEIDNPPALPPHPHDVSIKTTEEESPKMTALKEKCTLNKQSLPLKHQSQPPSPLFKDLRTRLRKSEGDLMVARYADAAQTDILKLRAEVSLNQSVIYICTGSEELDIMVKEYWKSDEVFHRRLLVSILVVYKAFWIVLIWGLSF